MINCCQSFVIDKETEEYLANKELRLQAILDSETAYRDSDFVVIATPTNYDPVDNFFDTSAVESVIQTVMHCNPNAIMMIKSTVPVDYTEFIRKD